MPSRLVECVPNFSEGCNEEVLHAILTAIRSVPGVLVLGDERDVDHHRSVITFVGAPEAAVEAAVRAAEVATQRINLTRHTGVHPRIGALDVLPFVPVRNVTLADCAQLAHRAGEQIWQRCRVPVYFYEAAALREDRRNLANIRRGNFEELRHLALTDSSRSPDIGGPALHPTAGAVAVGARKYLIAWNVLLRTQDPAPAKAIAATIRQSSGGFPFVKALGLPLASKQMTQVSMNLLDFEETPMQAVFDAICAEAEKWGVEVAGTELIGFLPRKSLEANLRSSLRVLNFQESRILENRLEELVAQRPELALPTPDEAAPHTLCREAARMLERAAAGAAERFGASELDGSATAYSQVLATAREVLAALDQPPTEYPEQHAIGHAAGPAVVAQALRIADAAMEMRAALRSGHDTASAPQPLFLPAELRHLTMAALSLSLAASRSALASEGQSVSDHVRQRIAALEAVL